MQQSNKGVCGYVWVFLQSITIKMHAQPIKTGMEKPQGSPLTAVATHGVTLAADLSQRALLLSDGCIPLTAVTVGTVVL